MAMEERVIEKIMQEVEEELEQTKRRIFWKLKELTECRMKGNNGEPQQRRHERGFFTLD
ncbi:MAG: hypothetical protein ACPLTR_11415 [Thermacetogeniaceae bacterium]